MAAAPAYTARRTSEFQQATGSHDDADAPSPTHHYCRGCGDFKDIDPQTKTCASCTSEYYNHPH